MKASRRRSTATASVRLPEFENNCDLERQLQRLGKGLQQLDGDAARFALDVHDRKQRRGNRRNNHATAQDAGRRKVIQVAGIDSGVCHAGRSSIARMTRAKKHQNFSTHGRSLELGPRRCAAAAAPG